MQPEVRLHCGRELQRGHAQQHTARAGAVYEAHLGEIERGQARRRRSGHGRRAQLVVSRLLGAASVGKELGQLTFVLIHTSTVP